LTPTADRPGHGLSIRAADSAQWRVA
jgi:hypothetical protein